MPMTEKTLRILIVDDNRDGADVLGLLVEELGNLAHVTYGGITALDGVKPDAAMVTPASADAPHAPEQIAMLH